MKRDEYRNEYLFSEHWSKTRRRLFGKNRQKRYCAGCRKDDVSLDVHHKTYTRLGNEKLRDLILVCRDCHSKIHEYHDQHKELRIIDVTARVLQMVHSVTLHPERIHKYQARLTRNLSRTTRRKLKKHGTFVSCPQCLRPMPAGKNFDTCYKCYMAKLRLENENRDRATLN